MFLRGKILAWYFTTRCWGQTQTGGAEKKPECLGDMFNGKRDEIFGFILFGNLVSLFMVDNTLASHIIYEVYDNEKRVV